MMIHICYGDRCKNVRYQQRKGESFSHFSTRVYEAISRHQHKLSNAIRIELLETSTGILLDTFYGLVAE